MSVQLPTVNLSAAVVGTTGKVSFGNALPPATLAQQMQVQAAVGGATLLVWNESGCGLSCRFPVTGKTFTIPSGGWRQLAVPPGESELDYTVSYVLPGASVALLLADLYLPGEAVDASSVLGTAPIGQSRVISIPTMPHKQAGLAPTTLAYNAPSGVIFLPLASGISGGQAITVYIYGFNIQMTGMRHGVLELLLEFQSVGFAVLLDAVIGNFPVVPGPNILFTPQPVAVGPFIAPASSFYAGISMIWVSGTIYPTTGSAVITANCTADIDLTGQTPPPAIGNGAATPVGASY